MTDSELMDRIAAADQEAFRTFYDRHSQLVFTVAVRILRQEHDAEELLEDVFWEIWNRADRYSASRGKPTSYLILLTRSRAIDRLRSRKSHGGATESLADRDPAADVADPGDRSSEQERRQEIRDALRGLDARQRESIECAFFDGLSHTEIAERFNRPLGTVKSEIRRGLMRLRDTLRRRKPQGEQS